MIKKFFLLAAILVIPTLSFGQTVCTVQSGASPGSLVAGGSISLLESTQELASLTCGGISFILPPGETTHTYTLYDDAAHTIPSDFITFTNGQLGNPATITIISDVCSTTCPETGVGLESPSAVSVTTTSGIGLRFTSDDDPNISVPSDVLSASPEPATFATFGTGLLFLAGFLRRKLGS